MGDQTKGSAPLICVSGISSQSEIALYFDSTSEPRCSWRG